MRKKDEKPSNSNEEHTRIPRKRMRVTIDEPESNSSPSLTVLIPRKTKSHAYCCICKRAGPKLVVVPGEVSFSVLLCRNIIIKEGSSCCPSHIADGTINPDLLKELNTVHSTELNAAEIHDIIQKLRATVKQSASKRLDFDRVDALSDVDCMNLTGLSKNNFTL